jgi:hypothetical protein
MDGGKRAKTHRAQGNTHPQRAGYERARQDCDMSADDDHSFHKADAMIMYNTI